LIRTQSQQRADAIILDMHCHRVIAMLRHIAVVFGSNPQYHGSSGNKYSPEQRPRVQFKLFHALILASYIRAAVEFMYDVLVVHSITS